MKLKAKSCLFDTHAHVNFNAFKADGEKILTQCLADGMLVVNVGSQYSTSKRAVEYAHLFDKEIYPHTYNGENKDNKYSENQNKSENKNNKNISVGVYAAIGIHPVHLKKGSFTHVDPEELTEEEIPTTGETFDYEKYLALAKDEKVVAIGEVGLDYHHFEEGDDVEYLKNLQKETLIKFIQLANVVDKPVMIHCWDGYDDLLEILQAYPVNKKGVVHSFIGSYKTANKFIELGFKLGLNGIVTYGDAYERLIKEIELENFVLETDCPYLTPRPLEKGIRNEPKYVEYVAAKIASVKNLTVDEVVEVTTENAKKILGI